MFYIRLSDTLERDIESLKGKEVLTIMLSICALRWYWAINGFWGCVEKEVASATENEDLISSWKDVDLWVMHLGCVIKEKLIERARHWILSLVRGGCLLEVEILGCNWRSGGSVGGGG